MSAENGGLPPLPVPTPTELANINRFDLEQAMDEAARQIDVAEPQPEPLELSIPEEPTIRKIFNPGDTDGEVTCAGYDSDGNPPPYPLRSDTLHQEVVVPNFYAAEEIFADANDGATENMFVLIENEVLQKMKVDELKSELDKRGLSKTGLKKDLLERMYKAMDEGTPCIDKETVAPAPTGFHRNARWKLLDSDVLPTRHDPPNESFGDAYAPSDRNGLRSGSRKFDYTEEWERGVYTKESMQPSLDRNGKVTRTRGKIKLSLQPVTKLTCNHEFLKKHGLDENSTPSDWIYPFLPSHKPKGSPPDTFITDQWAAFTNMKAEMEFAGNQASGGCYENFERFTPDEIRRHLILYSIQGLNPSPQLHMKMKHQREEPIQGCDAIANAMGANVKKRAQQFKKYFSVRHPYQEIPPSQHILTRKSILF